MENQVYSGRVYSGQEYEYKGVQQILDGLLKASQGFGVVGITIDDWSVSIDDVDFQYLIHIIELTSTHNFSKFYKRIGDNEFKFGGVLVKRGGV